MSFRFTTYKYVKCKFTENKVENNFICPEGEKLFFKKL